MSVTRPLPPRPNLEFERKEAKALHRQLRAGDRDALARAGARHPAMRTSPPDTLQLADAQLVIAREYGFASWPRLVRYFEDAERLLRRTPSAMNPGLPRPESWPGAVHGLLSQHQRRAASTARSLIAYVPRFDGLSPDEAFALTPTEDEARLAVARGSGYASWDALMARVQAEANDPTRQATLDPPPRRRAAEAIAAADLAGLQAVVERHPELLTPSEHEIATGAHLLAIAIRRERWDHAQGADPGRMRPIIDWLASAGFDVQRELDIRLCGDMRTTADDVQYWIDRGANPNWVAPNGFSVLEHAIARYWNAAALDRLAHYATVRTPALWIAAGLGDIAGVERFLDRDGKPTEAARAHRPHFDALGPHAFPPALRDDDDEIVMEAAVVAFLNGRAGVMEYLVSRGFPVDTLRWEMPLVVMAVGNNKVEMVEALVRCGADLDLRGAYNGSAREEARELLESQPPDADRRRIAELCGLDADAILAARDARPPVTPEFAPPLTRAVGLSTDDARRLGHAAVTPEHLLFGLLREGFPAVRVFAEVSGIDRERFRADVNARVQHGAEILDGAALPLDADAQAALDAAIRIATEHRRTTVQPQHLLLALVQPDSGVVVEMIERYGGSVAKVREFLGRMR